MSRKFTDNQGDDWVVFVDVDAAKRVRNLLDVDLLSFSSDQLLARLAEDYILLVDVLYVLCHAACEKRGISDVDFGRRLIGDPLEAARPALLRAIIDFFPKRRQAILAAVVDKIFEADAAMVARAEEAVATGALDQVVQAELAKADQALAAAVGGNASTRSPAD